ncbi:MAG TPA: alcohol dehydrogenase catalytic domain-containing protein [Candidatus Dormibacteraeota bacterium]|nr:alcohol dehydrogenase catalytic domain-containing protein [Candidatus Dormibacteraeota bacterium]
MSDLPKAMLAFRVQNGALKQITTRPPKLRRGWALVRVRLAGICNTDVEILRGYHGFHRIPGHEFAGEVVDVAGISSAVKETWIGKRVVGEINISCASLGFQPVCRFCRRGLKTHCARRAVLGILGHDGAFAEYLSLPIANLQKLPYKIDDEQAVFVEPLAAACEILTQVDVRKFRRAAVLGDGKLAQLIARALQTKIPRVVMYGKHSEKLLLARPAGIETRKIHGDDRDHKKLRGAFALVVEATGSPTGLRLAQEMTEPRGTLVLKSTFHGAAPVETWPTVVKELSIVGSRCGPFAAAISLLRSGEVEPRPLITRTFSLADAPKAIQFAQERGVMKVLLRP